MIRDDLSDRLIHLTKGSFEEAEKIFFQILKDEKIVASNKNVKGNHKVICFSEAPVSKLGIILANPNAHNLRYRPFGFMFEKKYLFNLGARPGIYQPNDEYDYLHPKQQFRHIRFEPQNDIDWTWEREWRMQTDELTLNHELVTLIIPNRSWEKKLQKEHHEKIEEASFAEGGFGPAVVGEFKWHFITLSDLGFNIPTD